MTKKKHIVTSALLYANGPIHIGHIAGAYLPADIYVRYLRSKQEDVVFICGSDEHGAAITLQAKKEKISPKKIIDKYHNLNKNTFENFGISFDIYDRTSEELHHETAQEFFKNLHKKNVFIKKENKQFYDEENNQFLADRYIIGVCPKCGHDHAYGDQCEKCGAALNPEELITPKSSISGNTPILKETTHWYLPMHKDESWLNTWIKEGLLNGKYHHNVKEWKKQVIGQCRSWIDGGLKDRAMTRDLDWGVKLPIEGNEGKVLYVWLDAPIGYISATKKWALENNKNWEDYWKNHNTNLIHFIGKDNIVFHCIMFPILLKAHGEYILPNNIPANEFLNLEGKKLSTSKNWAIWLHEYLTDFKGQEDALRYTLCATAPENKDSDFTWKDFQARNNNELVSIYGNFVNRVVVLINKYWNGIIPESNALTEYDENIIALLLSYPDKIGKLIEQYEFKKALQELMNLARLGNKYLADTEPWKEVKTNECYAKTVMNIAVQIAASLSILSKPFMPFTAKKLCNILSIEELVWEEAKKLILKKGHKINSGDHLFLKIEDEEIKTQLKKLQLQ